jgi:galactokinase
MASSVAETLIHDFTQQFHTHPRLFSAPGRINLIGEHVDYNEGFVLPMAIDKRTFVAASARADRRLRIVARDFNEFVEIDLDAPPVKRRGRWPDYVEGMARMLESVGCHVTGCNVMIASELSIGAGLASSAALEIGVGFAFAAVSGRPLEKRTLALAGQAAEHEYVGTQCGIMDQMVVALAEPGHVTFIDCRSLDLENIPFDAPDCVILACDSGVRHELALSEYNLRRETCEAGAFALRKVTPNVCTLRDVSPEDFSGREVELTEVVVRRCRHVVSEIHRAQGAARSLREKNWEVFGALMYASHRSLRDDYEVSCRELDFLVETALRVPGALGARMTGGGFGGCTVNLVRADAVNDFMTRVKNDYLEATGREANAFQCTPARGVCEEET